MPRSHIHDPPRRFHYGSNPTDDPGNDNFGSPIWMHYASTTTYVYGCNTEIYGLIRIVTDDAGSYPWLILRQILECVTWALNRKFRNPYDVSRRSYGVSTNSLRFMTVLLRCYYGSVTTNRRTVVLWSWCIGMNLDESGVNRDDR